jgi:hypothetical protein
MRPFPPARLIHVPGDAVRSPREGEAPSEPRGKARTEPRPPKEPDSISGFLYEGQDRGNAVIVGALAYVGPGVTVPIRLTPAPSSIARRSEPTRRSARAYVHDSNLPASSTVPAGAIIIGNKQVGTVEW